MVLAQIQKYLELIQRGSAASTYAQTEPPQARTRPAIDSLPGSGDRWLRRCMEDGSDHNSKISRPGLGDIIVTEGAPANAPVLTQLGAAVIRKHQLVNASTKALQQTTAVTLHEVYDAVLVGVPNPLVHMSDAFIAAFKLSARLV